MPPDRPLYPLPVLAIDLARRFSWTPPRLCTGDRWSTLTTPDDVCAAVLMRCCRLMSRDCANIHRCGVHTAQPARRPHRWLKPCARPRADEVILHAGTTEAINLLATAWATAASSAG